MNIRLAKLDDVGELSAIHCEALPDDLLPKLGRRFLERFYYSYVVSHEDHACVLAEESGSVTSVIVLSRDPAAITRHLRSNPVLLAIRLATAAVRDLGVAREVLAHAMKPRRQGRGLAEVLLLPELTLAATAPHAQGRGHGGAVLEASFDLVGFLRCGCMVKTSAMRAESFYRGHGFSLVGQEHRGRRRLSILVRRQRTADSSSACAE